MSKKLICILVFMLSLITFNNIVYADSYQATLTGDSVKLRNGPGTNYGVITSLYTGDTYALNSNNLYKDESTSSSNRCDAGWYSINYNGTTGYVCSSFVTVKTISDAVTNDCKTNLLNAGFPESYVNGLCNLKASHPNWSFVPLQTNLDWSYAVTKESSCGSSYVYTSDSNYIDSSCTNIYAGKVNGLYPASKTAVSYYMDPRNFFTEKGIFQFENLQYSSSLASYYPSGIASLLSGANFYEYHNNLGNNFSSILNGASQASNINPVFYASRILQELGRGTSEYNLYSGTYSGYEGYYNFINYGVSDTCAVTYGATACGLAYAKDHGWNSVYNSLVGAGNILTANYISQNQHTNYLQKFNVVPLNSSKIFIHQYMTNIGAPSSEAKSSYNVYNNAGLLDSYFVFYIPVYNNMDSAISNSDSGATKTDSSNTVTTTPISTIITSSGYSYASSLFTKVSPGTDASQIISAIGSVGGSATIKNQSGNVVTSGKVGTGYTISVNNSSTTETFTIIINGDTNGDGTISAVDLLQVQKQLLGTYKLTGAYNYAGDTNDDGSISAIDLLQVQKQLLGTYTINQ